ncbi:aminopeptidase y [Moniliophthora roreri MCA 2997]|uniref:Peptide hydrolase n=2 Tax=Moniliophthora roreri TaxID=221103 RepID=V2XME1_MONRO|nr:aminopeptidase y [Moniliophthora roreri MCA 2997]KAI3609492.1 aminopeptidase y [Moniliophthora roreri]
MVVNLSKSCLTGLVFVAVTFGSQSPRTEFAEFDIGIGIDLGLGGKPSTGAGRVDKAQLDHTLKSLAEIAIDNGGNRAFGLPGFDKSVEFIESSLAKFDSKKAFKVWKQPFEAMFTHVMTHRLNVTETESYVPQTLTYSPSTPAGGVTAELAVVPGNATPCNGEELAATGANVTGKILLIERGSCPDGTTFAGKVKTAKAGGAIAAIIFNSQDAFITGGTLTAPNPEYVPAGLIQRAQGLALRERALAGEKLIVEYEQIQVLENRTTTNIFAETKAGDPENLIMLGAHLDSVQAGPGVNDDGSGSTLILELFRTLDAKHVKNKVRFAWWGAEENGLLGSKFFTENLSAEEINDLLLYLNFDMVGRGYYGVFDGDGDTYGLAGPPGSDVIETLFHEFFESVNITVTPAVFTGGSDYRHFMEDLNKPVGGLHTGTGVDQDPCYHQACDGYENVNQTQLYYNTLAAQTVLAKLIKDGADIIPKNKTTEFRQSKLLFNSGNTFEFMGCGHDHDKL